MTLTSSKTSLLVRATRWGTALMLVALSACGSTDSSENPDQPGDENVADDGAGNLTGAELIDALKNVRNANIVGATSLFVAKLGTQGVTAQQGSDPEAKLYKTVADDAAPEEVVYAGDDPSQFIDNIIPPIAIYDAGDDYVMLIYHSQGSGYIGTNDFCFDSGFDGRATLLARKSDGAVFLVGTDCSTTPVTGGMFRAPITNHPIVQVDAAGNIYFLVQPQTGDQSDNNFRVRRIDTQNFAQPKIEYLTADGINVQYFAVAPDGTVMFSRQTQSGAPLIQTRSPDQSLQQFPNIELFWQGSKDLFAVHRVNIAEEGQPEHRVEHISKVVPNDSGELELQLYYDKPDIHSGLLRGQLINLNGHVVIVSGSILEIENPTNTPRLIETSLNAGARIVKSSKSAYYLLGTAKDVGGDLIVRVEPGVEGVKELIAPNTFDIKTMDVTPNDLVRFEGTRFSDSATVFVDIQSGGDLVFNDVRPFDAEAIVLERIR